MTKVVQKDQASQCLKIVFYECNPRESYLQELRNTIQFIEEGGLVGFEADPREEG